MTLHEHRLARLLERRSLEAAGLATRLDGMTWAEYAAAHWPAVEPVPYQSAADLARARARTRRRTGLLRDDPRL